MLYTYSWRLLRNGPRLDPEIVGLVSLLHAHCNPAANLNLLDMAASTNCEAALGAAMATNAVGGSRKHPDAFGRPSGTSTDVARWYCRPSARAVGAGLKHDFYLTKHY